MGLRRHRATCAQLALDIDLARPAFGRGGWRPGSGRKRGRRVSHDVRPAFGRAQPLHVTLKVVKAVARLRRRSLFAVVRRCIAESASESFRVCEMNVMGDHVHLIIEAAGPAALSKGMQRLATRMALRINRCLGRRGGVFADRYHARALRPPLEVRRALVYVLQNARHHDPRFSLAFDPWSSAGSFEGWAQALPDGEAWMRLALAEPRATAPPTTWLLRVGWRRHGLIRVDERPASGRRAAGPGRVAG